jgi:hypothetical protein
MGEAERGDECRILLDPKPCLAREILRGHEEPPRLFLIQSGDL